MTTATLLSSLVGNAFKSGLQSTAIETAQTYFDTSDGDSDGKDMATAMLAHAILLNQRQAEKGTTDNTIAVLSIDQLVNTEMQSLLNNANVDDFEFYDYKHPGTSNVWSTS